MSGFSSRGGNDSRDDRVTLSSLTATGQRRPGQGQPPKKLTDEDFSVVASRLFTDANEGLRSGGSGADTGEFWNNIMNEVSNLGFTFQHHRDDASASASAIESSATFSAPYDSENAKRHLDAVSALLDVSKSHAKVLTDIVLDELDGDTKGLGEELLGTKRLLLLVRDNHYAQQIARVKIIAEAMRIECQDDDGNDDDDDDDAKDGSKEDLRKKCSSFLDTIDERNIWRSSSRDPQLKRGIFRILVTMACAPAKQLGREEIYQARLLSDYGGDESSAGMMDSTSQVYDFAKQLMDEHTLHYDSSLRTEALEALFVLLYQRINGGIDRCDYVLLLHAFGSQDFFADCVYDHSGSIGLNTMGGVNNNSNINLEAKRRSQLTALILAECMGLWRAKSKPSDMTMTDDDHDTWINEHPFLGNPDRIKDEIDLIGQQLLQQKFANKVLERRQIQMLQRSRLVSGMQTSDEDDDDDVEAPEAIALLTFGLLLKLSHNEATQSGLNIWASDIKVKGLAVDCVSRANDDCGAFGYLSNITTFLLASPSPVDDFCTGPLKSSTLVSGGSGSTYDFQAIMLRKSLAKGKIASTQSASDGQDQESDPNNDEGTTMIHASIAREVLVATLSAFRSSLDRQSLEKHLDSARVDNLGMFCNLAAKIHRNSDVLCRHFWDEWNSTPESVDLSAPAALALSGVDPIAYLFDTAHTVATTAFATLSKANEAFEADDNMLSSDRGRQESSILPCLAPLFGILSSLIHKHGDAHTILQTCIPPGMIHAALLGCYYLCLEENCAAPRDEESRMQSKRTIDAAIVIIESICTISSMLAKMTNPQCVDWLKDTINYESMMTNLRGPSLLHGIAVNARGNTLLDINKAERMTSSALLIMAFLCQSPMESSNWAYEVGRVFSSSNDDVFTSFASQKDQVTVAFTLIWRQMASHIGSLAVTGKSEDSLLGLMKICARGAMLACDIISATPQTFDLPMTHYNILTNAICTVQALLQSVHAIASCCRNKEIVNLAKNIRWDQIQTLASSTALGSKIGFFATLLVSTQIADSLHVQNMTENMVSNPKFSLLRSGEEKKESHIPSVNMDQLKCPEDNQYTMNLCFGALSLLKTWGEVNERIATEDVDDSMSAGHLTDNIDHYNSEQRRTIASNLVSFGPCRLLLSSVIPPITPRGAQISNWPDESIPIMSLLTAYASWGSTRSSTLFGDMATTALDVLSKAVLHSNLDSSNHKESSQLTQALLVSVGSVGLQLRNCSSAIFSKAAPNMNDTEILLQAKILMFLELCIVYHPLLAKTMLNSDESTNDLSLVNSMLSFLDDLSLSTSKAVVLLHTLRVFTQLWHSCRGHYSASVLQGLTSVHPCDGIVHSLVSSDQLIKNCISIVEKLQSVIPEINIEDSITDIEPSIIHHSSIMLDIIQSAVRIIKFDAATHLLKSGVGSVDSTSIDFLKRSSTEGLLQQWLSVVGDHNGIILNTEAKEHFKEILNAMSLDISPSAFHSPSSLMVLIGDFTKSERKEALARDMLYSDATSIILSSQSNLNTELSRLGEILYMALDSEPSHTEVAVQAARNFYTLAEHAFSAFSCSSYVYSSAQLQQLVSSSNALTTLVITSLARLSKTCETKPIELMQLLEKILRASNWMIDIFDSNDQILEGSISLRLHTISCAILIFDHVGYKSEELKSYEDSQFTNDVRIGFCAFACECLSALRSSTSPREFGKVKNLCYEYNSANNSDKSTSPIVLLHTSISLLTTISLSTESKSSMNAGISSRSFHSVLADALKQKRAFQTLSYHLEQASSAAASIYANGLVGTSSEMCLETMGRILELSLVLCESKNMDTIEMILDSHFLSTVMKNQILSTACDQWSSPRYTKKGSDKLSRGYLSIYDQSSPNRSRKTVADPVHRIWRSTLEVIAALLHSTIQTPSGTDSRHRAAELAIDFLHLYEEPITNFMHQCLSYESVSNVSSNATPTSGFQFTVATIHELNDIFALVSELCTGDHRKHFKSASNRLYQVMSQAAVAIVRTLSSFFGALGVSRELFATLSSLDEIMGNPSSQDAFNMNYQNFTSRLIAESLPNAKHQAIRNALYASSCCKFITAHEESLSKGESKRNHNSREKLEQSFHSHVSNGFILLIESIAIQCVYNALSVVQSIHPCSSSFVTFTEEEVARLACSPPVGAIVAIRTGSDFAAQLLPSSANIRYGEVEFFNSITKTIDVHYFDDSTKEKHVSITKLAALEDISKRINIFEYKSAPDSVADNVASFTGNASIGNLILILRWCKQHMSAKSTQTPEVTKRIVTSIAEIASIILGDEIALHLELGSPKNVSEHETPSINRQLLELFDDEETLQNFDLSASSDSQKTPAVLQKGTDKNIWSTVQSQLQLSLVAGRADREIMKKNSEQAGNNYNAFNWGYKSTPTGSRRSPFS